MPKGADSLSNQLIEPLGVMKCPCGYTCWSLNAVGKCPKCGLDNEVQKQEEIDIENYKDTLSNVKKL